MLRKITCTPLLFFCLFLFMVRPGAALGQDHVDAYLATHAYSIDIFQTGPDSLDGLFKKKLPGYKILLLGEGVHTSYSSMGS